MDKSLIRWDPTREMISLRDAMDRLFGESFFLPWFSKGSFFEGEVLTLDMYETDEEVVVNAAVPGVKPDEIDLYPLCTLVLCRYSVLSILYA